MSAAIMNPVRTSTLTPGRPSGLSRSTATYYSSSSLPPSSLSSWSLDHSCTTFGLAPSLLAQHRRPSRLIDDEPDTTEEDHMRGIKRNRRMAMTKSPATVSKRRLCRASSSSSLRDCQEAARMLLSPPPPLSRHQHRSISSTSLSGPLHHSPSDSDGKKSEYSSSPVPPSCASQQQQQQHDLDDEADCPMPAPPSFRRRSTIRDPFDLASSIEDFKHFL